MKSKAVFSLLFSLLLAGPTMAIPAKPGLHKVKQPDGTEITVRLCGDERLNWFETEDGYKLLRNEDNFLVYALNNESGDLVPSNIIYRESNANSHILKSNLNISKEATFSKAQIMKAQQKAPYSTESNAIFPREGKRNLLMLLVNFSDTETTIDRQTIDNMMNQEGYNGIGSFKDYILEASDGKLDITTTVTDWIKISRPHDDFYYNQYRPNTYELVLEALRLIDKDYDFTKFDNDDDGYIDGIMVLHQGTGQESSGNKADIWSHSSLLSYFEPNANKRTFDGKIFNAYTVEPELVKEYGDNTVQTTIGVFCHEFTHNLGAPDYYDTVDTDNAEWVGTGIWDLMANGSWNGNNGDRPAMINAYQRIEFGWLPEPEVLTDDREITDLEAVNISKKVYKIPTNDSYDYFLLENRQKLSNEFEAGLLGSGLLIYHINKNFYNKYEVSNKINSTKEQSVYIVAANSNYEPGATPSTFGMINSYNALFGNNSSGFNKYTTPAPYSWKKEFAKGEIYNVTQKNAKVSFNFYKDKTFEFNGVYGKGLGINKKFRFVMDGPDADGSTFTRYNIYLKNGSSYERVLTIDKGNFFEVELSDEPVQLGLAFDLLYDNGVKTEKKEFSVYIPVECITSVSAIQHNNGINLSWEVDETKKNIKETTFKEFRIYKDGELIGSTTENSYTDNIASSGSTYTVLSVWDNDVETVGKSAVPVTSIEETVYSNNGNVVSCSYNSSSSNIICNIHCNKKGTSAYIKVYNMTGQIIATEALEEMTEGSNIVNVNCLGASKGIYIVTIKTILNDNKEQYSKKVVIL